MVAQWKHTISEGSSNSLDRWGGAVMATLISSGRTFEIVCVVCELRDSCIALLCILSSVISLLPLAFRIEQVYPTRIGF